MAILRNRNRKIVGFCRLGSQFLVGVNFLPLLFRQLTILLGQLVELLGDFFQRLHHELRWLTVVIAIWAVSIRTIEIDGRLKRLWRHQPPNRCDDYRCGQANGRDNRCPWPIDCQEDEKKVSHANMRILSRIPMRPRGESELFLNGLLVEFSESVTSR